MSDLKATIPTKREIEREKNRARNARRKQARAVKVSGAGDGKRLRRAFGGAFGKAPTKVYNVCAKGTTSRQRMDLALDEED